MWYSSISAVKVNPPNPTRLSPNLDSGGPTQLNPNLDPGDSTRPEIGFILGSFGFIKYIIGLKPYLNPICGQPDPIEPVFYPRDHPDPTQPNFGSQIGFNSKKWVGFGRTILNVVVVSTEYQARWNIWGHWGFVPTNFWQIS